MASEESSNTNASWNSDVWVYTPSSERTLLIVQSFFMLLLLVGMLIVSAGIYFLKRSRKDGLKCMPVTTTVTALLSMGASQASTFAYNTVSFRAHYAKRTYNVAQLIEEILSFISYCLLFYTFYMIIHIFGERVTKIKPRTLSVLRYTHWGIVGLFVLLCIVDWGYYVALMDSMVKGKTSVSHRYDVWVIIDSVRWVVFWVSAWEIAGWAIFLGLMTSRDSSYIKYKMSSFLFVAASGCFLGVNFLWFVWCILGLIQSSSSTFSGDVTGPGETARQIVVFVFIQGMSLAIFLCYWRFPVQEAQSEDAELEQLDKEFRLEEATRIRKSSCIMERLADLGPAEADSRLSSKCRAPRDGYSELVAEPDQITHKEIRSPVFEADSANILEK